MKRFLTVLMGLAVFAALGLLAEEAAKLAGSWQMAVETPHGPMQGSLLLKQEGAKLSGTLEMEHFGTLPLAGEVDGRKVSFTVEIDGNPFKFSGEAESGRLAGTTDPFGGSWTATRK